MLLLTQCDRSPGYLFGLLSPLSESIELRSLEVALKDLLGQLADLTQQINLTVWTRNPTKTLNSTTHPICPSKHAANATGLGQRSACVT